MQCQRARYRPEGGNRLYDGEGLYLQLQPTGAKLWRFKYRFGNAEKLLALGAYPEIGRLAARQARADARALLAKGVDPFLARKAERDARSDSARNSFEAVAREWYGRFSPGWAPTYAAKVLGRLEKDVFPWLGRRPIAEIEAPELLETLRRIESRGAVETTRRQRQIIGQIFRYAIATARAKRDPAADLRGAFAPPAKRHFATLIEPARIGELMRAIHGYQGHFTTCAALRLAPLVFVRPGELRLAEWSELNLAAAEWRIPPARLKLRQAAKLNSTQPHVVPLSRQALEVLQELHRMTGRGRFLFPSIRTPDRGMSDNTINAALRRMGYDGTEIVGHGFRHMASTLLNESGWSADAIERQLAHKAQGVRAVYNLAEYMPERRRMMQAWADYLDALRIGQHGASMPNLSAP
jgi:integrase